MKFGRVLVLRSIPEWRESYVGYKRLKRLLKRLPEPKGGGDADIEGFSPEVSLSGTNGALTEPLLQLPEYSEVEALFFAALDEDLAKVNQLVRPPDAPAGAEPRRGAPARATPLLPRLGHRRQNRRRR